MVWSSLVWYDLLCYSMVWCNMVWCAIAWNGVVWYGHASRILLPNILPQSNLTFIFAATELIAAFQTKTTLVNSGH